MGTMTKNELFAKFAQIVADACTLRIIIETREPGNRYYMVDANTPDHRNDFLDDETMVCISSSDATELVSGNDGTFATYMDGWRALSGLVDELQITDIYVETY